MRLIIRILLFLIVVGGWTLESAAAEIAVIVSKDLDLASLSQSDIKRVFLGKKRKLAGKKVKLVDLKNSDISARFYADIIGKSGASLRKYRAKLIFTGRGRAPKEVSTPSEVKSFVSSESGAIGYIPASDLDASVKAVFKYQ